MSSRPVPRIIAQQYAKSRAQLWLDAKLISDLLVNLLDRQSRNIGAALNLARQIPSRVKAFRSLARKATIQWALLQSVSRNPDVEYRAAIERAIQKLSRLRLNDAQKRVVAYQALAGGSTGLEGLAQLEDEVNAAAKKISATLKQAKANRKYRKSAVGDVVPLDDDTPEAKLTEVPVVARKSSGYGWRIHPIKKVRKFHAGLDMAAASGTPVFAAGDGLVEFAKNGGNYGNLVRLDHGDGLTTRYAHLSKILVKKGERVKAGQLIGKVGTTGASTGPHLHFEVRVDGHPKDPLKAIPAILASQTA